jgi:hypothetical protein
MSGEGGTKKDQGKPRICLIPVEAINAAAEALMFGADKYGDYNYRGGLKHTRILDSVFRHLTAHLNGEDVDSESGLKHLSHAIAGLSMLIWMTENRPDLDDRYSPFKQAIEKVLIQHAPLFTKLAVNDQQETKVSNE